MVELELVQDLGNTLPCASVPKRWHSAPLLFALENLGQLNAQRGSILPN
jgi:hypothetical protein